MFAVIDVIFLTLVAAGLVAYAQYVFKRTIPKFKFNVKGVIELATNRGFVLGALIYAVGLVFYLLALGSDQLSFVYPAFSSTFIFVIMISHFKLRERVGAVRLAGVVMILLGIALVSSLLVI